MLPANAGPQPELAGGQICETEADGVCRILIVGMHAVVPLRAEDDVCLEDGVGKVYVQRR